MSTSIRSGRGSGQAIRFESNALMSAAHLTDTDDGGKAFVFCAIPGGRPFLVLRSRDGAAISITNAPTCDTDREFRTFVSERFGS